MIAAMAELDDALAALCDAYAARALDEVAGRAVLPLYAEHVMPRLTARARAGDVGVLLARTRALAPPPLVDLLERAGEALADVLLGERDASEAYLVDETTRFLYETSPPARWANGQIAARVAAAAPRRVIEIGAGTGGTTRAVLAAFAVEDYLFTDTSTTLLRRAAKRLPGVRTARFDVERPPGEQGLPLGEAGAVIAANVVHATRDLDEALAHARALLAPGGVLLLWEATREETWFDVTIALLPGWHRHADAHRRGSPLLGSAAWAGRLRGMEVEIAEADGQAVIAARTPA